MSVRPCLVHCVEINVSFLLQQFTRMARVQPTLQGFLEIYYANQAAKASIRPSLTL